MKNRFITLLLAILMIFSVVQVKADEYEEPIGVYNRLRTRTFFYKLNDDYYLFAIQLKGCPNDLEKDKLDDNHSKPNQNERIEIQVTPGSTAADSFVKFESERKVPCMASYNYSNYTETLEANNNRELTITAPFFGSGQRCNFAMFEDDEDYYDESQNSCAEDRLTYAILYYKDEINEDGINLSVNHIFGGNQVTDDLDSGNFLTQTVYKITDKNTEILEFAKTLKDKAGNPIDIEYLNTTTGMIDNTNKDIAPKSWTYKGDHQNELGLFEVEYYAYNDDGTEINVEELAQNSEVKGEPEKVETEDNTEKEEPKEEVKEDKKTESKDKDKKVDDSSSIDSLRDKKIYITSGLGVLFLIGLGLTMLSKRKKKSSATESKQTEENNKDK